MCAVSLAAVCRECTCAYGAPFASHIDALKEDTQSQVNMTGSREGQTFRFAGRRRLPMKASTGSTLRTLEQKDHPDSPQGPHGVLRCGVHAGVQVATAGVAAAGFNQVPEAFGLRNGQSRPISIRLTAHVRYACTAAHAPLTAPPHAPEERLGNCSKVDGMLCARYGMAEGVLVSQKVLVIYEVCHHTCVRRRHGS